MDTTYNLTIEQLGKLCRDFQADCHDGFVSNDNEYIEQWVVKEGEIIQPATNIEIRIALTSAESCPWPSTDGYLNNLRHQLNEYGIDFYHKRIDFYNRFKDSKIFKEI